MAWASTYPAAKAKLIALWDAAVPQPIINGPNVGAGQDAVGTVGFQDENNPLTAEIDWTQEGASPIPTREQYLVYCSAGINWGSTVGVIPDAEAAVFGLFNALAGVLGPDITLGTAGVMNARVERGQLYETQGGDGLTVVLKFTVAIDAYTTV
jgi:hypothetical protein